MTLAQRPTRTRQPIKVGPPKADDGRDRHIATFRRANGEIRAASIVRTTGARALAFTRWQPNTLGRLAPVKPSIVFEPEEIEALSSVLDEFENGSIDQ